MRRSARIGLYSESEQIGGAERSLLHLLAHAGRRNELVLCTSSQPLLLEASRHVPAIERHLLPRAKSGFVDALAHRKALRALKLDLLQITLGNPFRARSAMLAAFSLRLPTVAVEQLVLPARRRRGRVLKHVLSRPLAAHVVVGRQSAVDLARFYRLPERTLTVIYNGIPDVPVEPIPFEDGPVVGSAARLEEQKGFDILIAAMRGVPSARLVLVGDGRERCVLEHQVNALGMEDRVEFCGWLDDARPAIKGFDVFALASRTESFPLTIVEAMLSGVPVVATNVGSVAEAIIDERTGLLVQPGDVDGLASGIRRLLDDAPLRADLIARARVLAVERFTVESMVAGYERLWSEVLAGSKPEPKGTTCSHDDQVARR
jgi:glycosyltransferase involved in cell wall biosynthesis